MRPSWLSKKHIAQGLILCAILLFYASFLVYRIALPAADDLPRQIRIGEEVLHGNWDILYRNIFSYTEPDHRFFNHHWFSGVVFYVLYHAIGWSGLVLFKVGVFFLTFLVLFATAVRKAPFWVVALCAIPTVLILSERTGLRPEVFSYLFLATYLYLLTDSADHPERNWIFALIPLQLFWVNMHVFFSIGIMMTFGFLFERLVLHGRTWRQDPYTRKLLFVAAGVFLVSFLNPRGVAGVFYRYPPNFPLLISENQSISDFLLSETPFSDPAILVFKISAVLLVASFLYAFRTGKKPIFFALGALATMALGHVILRGISLFAFIFLPAITANIAPLCERVRLKVMEWYPWKSARGYAAGTAVFVLAVVMLIAPSWWRRSVERGYHLGILPWSDSSGEFFLREHLTGPIFCDGDVGSYVIFKLYPQEKTFADNRFADAYSADFFSQLLNVYLDEDAWQQALARYKFNVIFSYHYSGTAGARNFIAQRAKDPAWALVHADPFVVIFVRNTPENKRVIDQYHITAENASERLAYLLQGDSFDEVVAGGDLANLIGNPGLANQTYLRILRRWPNAGRVWALMGQIAFRYDDEPNNLLALMFLQKAIEKGQGTAEVYTGLGAVYRRLGEDGLAADAFRKALSINPGRADTRDMLDLITGVQGQ